MMAAVWVLIDFIEEVEFHSVSDYPAKLLFFAGGYRISPKISFSANNAVAPPVCQNTTVLPWGTLPIRI